MDTAQTRWLSLQGLYAIQQAGEPQKRHFSCRSKGHVLKSSGRHQHAHWESPSQVIRWRTLFKLVKLLLVTNCESHKRITLKLEATSQNATLPRTSANAPACRRTSGQLRMRSHVHPSIPEGATTKPHARGALTQPTSTFHHARTRHTCIPCLLMHPCLHLFMPARSTAVAPQARTECAVGQNHCRSW